MVACYSEEALVAAAVVRLGEVDIPVVGLVLVVGVDPVGDLVPVVGVDPVGGLVPVVGLPFEVDTVCHSPKEGLVPVVPVDLVEDLVDQEEVRIVDRIEFVAEEDIGSTLVQDRVAYLEADTVRSLVAEEGGCPCCMVAGFADRCFQTVNSRSSWLYPKCLQPKREINTQTRSQ